MITLARAHKMILMTLVLLLLGCSKPAVEPLDAADDNDLCEGLPCNVFNGFSGNQESPGVVGATIGGGGQVAFPNMVQGDFGVIGGGKDNLSRNLSVIAGGFSNAASGLRAFIGGGAHNEASRDGAVVGGGYANLASQSYTVIGGGTANVANGSMAVVGGGSGNLANGRHATVAGGTHNLVESAYAVIGGGSYNQATGGTSTVAGGTRNQALGIGSAIGGGAGNRADGLQSTVSGGLGNRVSDNYSLVPGGRGNLAGNANDDPEDAGYATVGGGLDNRAEGAFSVVAGGYANRASGDFSYTAGSHALVEAGHPGVILFANSSDYTFTSIAPDEFAVRASGGVRFITALDESGLPLAGVRLGAGSGTWESLSDRDTKAAIFPVDGRQVLDALLRLPISTWRYIGQAGSIRHLGPMAQDFFALFGLGQDQRYIGALDADGVALAAIQGVYQLVQEKDTLIAALQVENAWQGEQLADLEARLAALEKRADPTRSSILTLLVAALSLSLGGYSRAASETVSFGL